MKKFLSVVLCAIVAFSLCGCFEKQRVSTSIFGVWWWNNDLDQSYLDFAVSNNINEIYFCDENFENTQFVLDATQKGIDVYWLIGEKEWLLDMTKLEEKVDSYIQFNSANDNIYSGIHLDIEPHQFDDFDQNRQQYIYNLIDLANTLDKKYPNIFFDYDIPFWLDDSITYNNITKPAYAHMIDVADCVFLMSYRDSATAMLDVSKEEIEYATSVNKQVVLGAETSASSETEIVTYYEEGKNYMNQQLEIVKQKLPDKFGVSIHHMKSWRDLKE